MSRPGPVTGAPPGRALVLLCHGGPWRKVRPETLLPITIPSDGEEAQPHGRAAGAQGRPSPALPHGAPEGQGTWWVGVSGVTAARRVGTWP